MVEIGVFEMNEGGLFGVGRGINLKEGWCVGEKEEVG